jgi:hypothetical protein
MPATQRGHAYRLGPNRWGLRYRDANGKSNASRHSRARPPR